MQRTGLDVAGIASALMLPWFAGNISLGNDSDVSLDNGKQPGTSLVGVICVSAETGKDTGVNEVLMVCNVRGEIDVGVGEEDGKVGETAGVVEKLGESECVVVAVSVAIAGELILSVTLMLLLHLVYLFASKSYVLEV